jgi:DNA repair exonuclease SbcCD ATPase subunit
MSDPFVKPTYPTTKELNQEAQITALDNRLTAVRADLKSAEDIVRLRNSQITRLEQENLRLKLDRTDTALRAEVVGLRKDVGTKDRRLVELERAIEKLKESEVISLRRAVEAERRVETFATTLATMQKARDVAQELRVSANENFLKASGALDGTTRKLEDVSSQLVVLSAAAEAALRVLSADTKKVKAIVSLEVLVHATKKKMEEGA